VKKMVYICARRRR